MFEMPDRKTVLAALLGIVIIGGVTVISIDTQMLSEETRSFAAEGQVTDALNESDVSLNNSLGFDATTERLAFGRMPLIDHEGLSGRRFLNFSTGQRTLVHVSASGNISEHLNYTSPQLFEPGDHELRLLMFPNEQGWLEGTVTVRYETAKQGTALTPVAERWLSAKYWLYSRF